MDKVMNGADCAPKEITQSTAMDIKIQSLADCAMQLNDNIYRLESLERRLVGQRIEEPTDAEKCREPETILEKIDHVIRKFNQLNGQTDRSLINLKEVI